jgi:hypothetical protein
MSKAEPTHLYKGGPWKSLILIVRIVSERFLLGDAEVDLLESVQKERSCCQSSRIEFYMNPHTYTVLDG